MNLYLFLEINFEKKSKYIGLQYLKKMGDKIAHMLIWLSRKIQFKFIFFN